MRRVTVVGRFSIWAIDMGGQLFARYQHDLERAFRQYKKGWMASAEETNLSAAAILLCAVGRERLSGSAYCGFVVFRRLRLRRALWRSYR